LQRLADEKKIILEFFESNTRSAELTEGSLKKFHGGLAYLKKFIADVESGAGETELDRTLQAWLSCDFTELLSVQAEYFAKYPHSLNVQLRRNKEWVAVAKRLIPDKTPTLFVVGAFHTVGKGSLIEQMENEGFKLNLIGNKKPA
jgi:uncharacterized protein YbaP (TraB family)